MLKFGIIGTGQATSISKGHLIGIQTHPESELIGVYDRNRNAVENWCNAFGVDHSLIYEDVDRMIDDADALVICTPNFAHTEYILKCIEKGKHILCEKPVTSNREDLEKVREALKGYTGKTMTNLSYRYIPALAKIRELIASGKAGQVYTIRHNMGMGRLANEEIGLEWRFIRKMSGSGALCDFGSHAIDILHTLFGDENTGLDDVDCYSSTFIKQRKNRNGELQDVENDDADMISGRLSGGALYSLLLCRLNPVVSQIEAICRNALIRYIMDAPDRIWVTWRKPGEAYGTEEEILCENCREAWHHCTYGDVPFECAADNLISFADAILNDREVKTT